ncbi:MAG: FAD-dependent oxidoreductase [Pirellulaceae bacterium]
MIYSQNHQPLRIAVIGSGISGMLSARLLATRHQVDVYEANEHVGGHAHTVEVAVRDARGCQREIDADVAFMVLNRRTYPNFCQMLAALGVPTQDSDMSLSVRCLASGLEYQGSSLNGIFSQRKNLFRPTFWKMLRDIARFNSLATTFCESPDDSLLLGAFLDRCNLGEEFRRHYLIPMSAAIWSSDTNRLEEFPAKFILGFLHNHGLLQLKDRPQWLTIADRSRRYVEALTGPIRNRVFTNTPVLGVHQDAQVFRVEIDPNRQGQRVSETYDHVVFATHADQTLRLLSDCNQPEREVLSGFAYQANEAVLHTDTSVLPRRPRAWASWNYHLPADMSDRVSVTYDLNRLQSLGLGRPLCLTLNPNCRIKSDAVLKRFEFQHPVFSENSVRSQSRFHEINHQRGISFCGAYWGHGFHEDGANSALAVTERFGIKLADIDRPVIAGRPLMKINPGQPTPAS